MIKFFKIKREEYLMDDGIRFTTEGGSVFDVDENGSSDESDSYRVIGWGGGYIEVDEDEDEDEDED